MSLEFIGDETLKLEHGLYLWIDIKRFAMSQQAFSASDALDLLIQHPQYRDHYLSPDSQQDDGTVHGPYRLDAISTSSFDAIERAEATATIDAFLALYGGPGETKADEVRAAVGPLIDSASQVYRLRDLGEKSHHDAGWVMDDFNELVFVDQPGRSVALLVAAGD